MGCNNYEVIDLGVMVPAQKILDTAISENVDIIGLSGLITPSLDEMVHVAKEMTRRDFKMPLIIGGATTSRAHTAVKVAPSYTGATVHVLDASRSVDVLNKLLGTEKADYVADINATYQTVRDQYAARDDSRQLISLEQARANAPVFDWARADIKRPHLSITKVFEDYPLERILPRIDWSPFFIAWELKGRYPKIFEDPHVGEVAQQLFDEAQALIKRIVKEKLLTAKAVFGIYPANSVGDDIRVYTDETRSDVQTTFHTLRQQVQKREGQPNLALSDYIAPETSGVTDHMGAFVVSIHGAQAMAAEFEAEQDDYNAILIKAIADRLAEAFAEHLHELVRKGWWGYAEGEDFSNEDLVRERYRGIRPAPGYPAQPDHTEKPALFELLGAQQAIGTTLTESNAMSPAASVSGMYLAHPESRYFAVGKLQRDQVADYAKRKGMTLAEAERWLAPNLAYTPEERSLAEA